MTVSPPQQRTVGLSALIPNAPAERDAIVEALGGGGPSPVTLALAGHLLARAATGGTLAPDEQRLAAEVAAILAGPGAG